MSKTLAAIQDLVARGDILISSHGYDELANDDIRVDAAVAGAAGAILVEDYPDFAKGPSCLVRQLDSRGAAIHVVWGIPRGADHPAVLITAYRPDPTRWTADFLQRKAR